MVLLGIVLLTTLTRWMAMAVLRDRWVQVSLAGIAGGVATTWSGHAAVGVLLVSFGLLLAGITNLRLQDMGAQPWLGLIVIAMSAASAVLVVPDGDAFGDPHLPTDASSWIGAAFGLLAALSAAAGLWSRYYRPLSGTIEVVYRPTIIDRIEVAKAPVRRVYGAAWRRVVASVPFLARLEHVAAAWHRLVD